MPFRFRPHSSDRAWPCCSHRRNVYNCSAVGSLTTRSRQSMVVCRGFAGKDRLNGGTAVAWVGTPGVMTRCFRNRFNKAEQRKGQGFKGKVVISEGDRYQVTTISGLLPQGYFRHARRIPKSAWW